MDAEITTAARNMRIEYNVLQVESMKEYVETLISWRHDGRRAKTQVRKAEEASARAAAARKKVVAEHFTDGTMQGCVSGPMCYALGTLELNSDFLELNADFLINAIGK